MTVCGDCVKFHTKLCSFGFSKVPINPKPKAATSMSDFLRQLYDYTEEPYGYYRLESNYSIILPNDVACTAFVQNPRRRRRYYG